jgi:hypothetical protein
MILHLFTSSKGGVGKTLCSLSTTVNYLSQPANKVLCLDLNWINADFSRFMATGRNLTSNPPLMSSDICTGRGKIHRFKNFFTLPLGALGFWENIELSLQKCREDSFNLDYAIIDTGLHVANLIRRTHKDTIERTVQKIQEIKSKFQINKVYIWFIWTLASILSAEDGAGILMASTYLEDALGINCFNKNENLIHVLNPHALYPAPSLAAILNYIKSRGISEYFVHGAEKLRDKPLYPGGPELEEFVMTIRDGFNQIINSADKKENLLSELCLTISDHYNARPRNVFPITVFSSNLVGYPDSLVRIQLDSIEKLRSNFGTVYKDINKYLKGL